MRMRLLILLCLFWTGICFGQGQVTVHLKTPPPNQLGVKDLWNLTLTNTSGKEIKIYLEGTLDEVKESRIVDGRTGFFTLKAKETKQITANNIPGGGTYNWQNKKFQEGMIRTGNAPEGMYTICVNAKSEDERIMGQDCFQQNISVMSPPMLISPEDGAVIKPDGVSFMWTGTGLKGLYNLKIVEVQGNQSPSEAMQRNSVWFEKKDIKTTNFIYPTSARKFEKGKKYAWQVIVGNEGSEIWAFKIIIEDPTQGCFEIDTTQYKVECNGFDSNGQPKYKLTNLILKNVGTNPGNTGLHGGPITNYITPTGFTISNLNPPSATNILPNNSISISFEISGAANSPISFVVKSTIPHPTNPNLYCDKTIGVSVDLPPCICEDCDSLNWDFNLTASHSNSDQYDLNGSLGVNLPIFGVEFQVQSWSYTASPNSCSNGVTHLEESAMFLLPATTINNNSAIQVFNENVSGSSSTNNNATKKVKLLSTTAMPNPLPVNFTIGLPGALPGLPPNCCTINYKVCIEVTVFYDAEHCKSCTYVKCFEFTNQ
ncbi:MAG: hypothetical protein WCR42_06760 [bacterium]